MLRKYSRLQVLFGLTLLMGFQLTAYGTLSGTLLAANTKQQRPNIILFITDDQSPFTWKQGKADSAKAFGFNGQNEVYTPEIDRLAHEGMIFTRAYVSSSVCSPSRYTSTFQYD